MIPYLLRETDAALWCFFGDQGLGPVSQDNGRLEAFDKRHRPLVAGSGFSRKEAMTSGEYLAKPRFSVV